MPIRPVPKDSRPFLSLSLFLPPNSFFDLGEFEENKLIIGVAISMVVNKELKSFLISAFTDEESRGLRDELNSYEEV